ncbi:DNA-formamidopyrimidine glycosylase family protein [Corynebacterium caspium]|uniref:DNA-formamidopyrimidine glycosylase family protein n=1 Tax=Corynebacterium caspium TaxID=234828 RepID=UPI00035FED2A|nr:DNA-formamidopyrimidine glycosylase family protein [Corynebacterium caspium]WKD59643.1 Endonuclease 8 1 [Corynebacterium caspium DSM 44850]
MPEGDSVHQLARRLKFMEGREVLDSSLRVPRFATTNFNGLITQEVWPYGKHLFMRFDDQILHTHLKMEGTWAVHLKGDKWKKPGYTARVVLVLEPQTYPRPLEVVGHDLGLVEVFPAAEYKERMEYLGPDVLHNWDILEAKRRILAKPERAIGAALLDQRNLAGVGNEYRAEICFLAGVHPARAVATVDITQILEITYRLMMANKDSPIRVSTGVMRPGETSYVFGRNNKPCRRCGTLIRKSTLGGPDSGGEAGELERIIWWCPNCQPL